MEALGGKARSGINNIRKMLLDRVVDRTLDMEVKRITHVNLLSCKGCLQGLNSLVLGRTEAPDWITRA